MGVAGRGRRTLRGCHSKNSFSSLHSRHPWCQHFHTFRVFHHPSRKAGLPLLSAQPRETEANPLGFESEGELRSRYSMLAASSLSSGPVGRGGLHGQLSNQLWPRCGDLAGHKGGGCVGTSPTSSLEDKWFRGHWRCRRPQLPQELSQDGSFAPALETVPTL